MPAAPRPSAPQDVHVLSSLRQLQPHLPRAAGRAASFILDHASTVLRMSITELAEQAGVSEGSVVALCRRIGVSGFHDLKILLSRDLVEPVRLIQEDLLEGDAPATVAERVFSAHIASLSETRRLLNPAALETAVRAVRAASRVEVYGIGSSAPMAEDLGYRLLQIGVAAKTVTDSHVQAVSAAMTGPGVATITVSHSGSTTETVLCTRLAREAGACTIGITRLGRSPIARHCDILLHTVANETRYRPEAMSSRVAQLALIDTLVSSCALADPDRSVERLRRSQKAISSKRL